jgi:hypothetical protein
MKIFYVKNEEEVKKRKCRFWANDLKDGKLLIWIF